MVRGSLPTYIDAGTVIYITNSHDFKISHVCWMGEADPYTVIDLFILLLGTQCNVINKEAVEEIIVGDVIYSGTLDFE